MHGLCEDYGVGWTIDKQIDEQERGTRRVSAPLLVLWGERGTVAKSEPLRIIWRTWTEDVWGHSLPCGHFLPEEASAGVMDALQEFMGV